MEWLEEGTVLDGIGKLHLSEIHEEFVKTGQYDAGIRKFSKVMNEVLDVAGIKKEHALNIGGVKKPGYIGRRWK